MWLQLSRLMIPDKTKSRKFTTSLPSSFFLVSVLFLSSPSTMTRSSLFVLPSLAALSLFLVDVDDEDDERHESNTIDCHREFCRKRSTATSSHVRLSPRSNSINSEATSLVTLTSLSLTDALEKSLSPVLRSFRGDLAPTEIVVDCGCGLGWDSDCGCCCCCFSCCCCCCCDCASDCDALRSSVEALAGLGFAPFVRDSTVSTVYTEYSSSLSKLFSS
mmetsp:Transcript_10435/g.30515  ORF Transcript_10435/g.30515 Transcript_10435/m.30515 type:complete len:218 (-) Transcript_10435:532-1185(-)